jgi:excisionase family DNA binding protein
MQRVVFFMPEDIVFTVQEVAAYLRMQPVTIYKHAKAGKLPCFKVGAKWRFKKSTIDRWISGQEEKDNNGHSA